MKKTITLAALAAMASPAFGVVYSTGLELYYNYDSGTVSGTTVTDQWTGDGNADNVSRTSLSTTTGKFGDALVTTTVNGTPRSTSDASTINSTFLPGTGDYTLTFWYRQDAPTAWGNRIWSAGARNAGGPNGGLQLYLQGPSQAGGGGGAGFLHVTAQAPNGASEAVLTGSTVGTWDGDAWNHIAAVRSGNNLSLFVNGTEVISHTLATTNIAVGDGTWYREASFGPAADTIGNSAYDDASIFRRALSSAELAEIYNGGTGQTIAAAMVPEPSSAALLGLGGLALILRRRK